MIIDGTRVIEPNRIFDVADDGSLLLVVANSDLKPENEHIGGESWPGE